jgi:hypothetical protein
MKPRRVAAMRSISPILLSSYTSCMLLLAACIAYIITCTWLLFSYQRLLCSSAEHKVTLNASSLEASMFAPEWFPMARRPHRAQRLVCRSTNKLPHPSSSSDAHGDMVILPPYSFTHPSAMDPVSTVIDAFTMFLHAYIHLARFAKFPFDSIPL